MADLLDLTPRETEILKLVLAGLTNKAIAVQLCTTVKTVEFHLDHIYTKTGMRTRLMTGTWAMQQGLELEAQEIPGQEVGVCREHIRTVAVMQKTLRVSSLDLPHNRRWMPAR